MIVWPTPWPSLRTAPPARSSPFGEICSRVWFIEDHNSQPPIGTGVLPKSPVPRIRGGPSIGHGCTHVQPIILVLANEIQVSRRKHIYCRELVDSDPNTDSFVRVWGAPSRTAQGRRRGGRGIPGRRMRSSPAKGWAAARPVAAAREGRSRAREEIRREFLSERRERLEKRNRGRR